MARRRPFNTTRSIIKPGRRQRIRIPQPIERPLHLRSRDALKGEVIERDADWFILHRRGLNRPIIGAGRLEARAVPKSEVRGTLPERIMYKYLRDNVRWQEGVIWTFQSSLDGGRAELGGLVADFIIYHLKLILNPMGPTHEDFLRMAKDDENDQTYAEFGYIQEAIPEAKVYDEMYFEAWMRKVLGFHTGVSGSATSNYVGRLDGNPDDWQAILLAVQDIHADVAGM
jgi:hypothetical protein